MSMPWRNLGFVLINLKQIYIEPRSSLYNVNLYFQNHPRVIFKPSVWSMQEATSGVKCDCPPPPQAGILGSPQERGKSLEQQGKSLRICPGRPQIPERGFIPSVPASSGEDLTRGCGDRWPPLSQLSSPPCLRWCSRGRMSSPASFPHFYLW